MGETGPKLETCVGGASHAPRGHGALAIVPEAALHSPHTGGTRAVPGDEFYSGVAPFSSCQGGAGSL